ncbi:hypothetical protein C1H46_026679 [Malus baccata]|uniref:Semialdehyde dehydrogenase NAD-binding domain-containing protein n=1 Tax=Malus baccata TaxID=106549 RepID=A0A540LMP0_MALBA|nr:hypothetical protein C1H46_026679 [Malus baccata]
MLGRVRVSSPTIRILLAAPPTCESAELAVVGVTGAVGQESISVLQDRDFPFHPIKMLASKRSAGQSWNFLGQDYVVEELTHDSFDEQKQD